MSENEQTAQFPTILFEDDFTTVPTGCLPDATKWAFAVGPPAADPTNGSQYYHVSPDTCFVDANQHLIFRILPNGGGTAVTTQARGNWISTRISTFYDINSPGAYQLTWSRGRTGFTPFKATWGTLTISAAANCTAGFWPAMWLLGTDYQWPACGEIDMFENFGGYNSSINQVYGNVYGPNRPGDYTGFDWDASKTNSSPSGININDGNFHTYSVSISQDYETISFKLDGQEYGNSPVTRTEWLAAATAAGAQDPAWPFGVTAPLGIVMNVCVGGTVSTVPMGFPSLSLTYPLDIMKIDYVRFTQP